MSVLTRLALPGALLLAGLTAGTTALGKKPAPPPPPPAATSAAPVGPSLEERNAAFGEIDELYRSGQKARTADALVALVDDPSKASFHAEAYARLGAVLEELDLPYGAVMAYERALATDAMGVSSVAKKAIKLADTVGDTALLEPVFAANVGLDVDAATRSRMAYLAAREAHRQGSYNTALGILKMVQPDDPFYAEAKSLEGVVLSLQGRHKDALAPLLIAQAKADEAKKNPRLQNAIRLNLARAYFAAENFPRSIEYYATVERSSVYWPEAQFERAWAHFRLTDVNGAIGLLHSLGSPFFDDWYFPEADLLRVYSEFLLCKFPDASRELDVFKATYTPALATLREVGSRDADAIFAELRKHVEARERGRGTGGDLPRMITRQYEDEDRFLDSLNAIRKAEDEITRLQNVAANPFAAKVADQVRARRKALIEAEGGRVKDRANRMADQLDGMLGDAELSKLDMIQFETRLYERASQTGKLPDKRAQVEREIKVKRDQRGWPWEGEYWADELGYYRVNTPSDCPASLRPEGEKKD